MTAPGQNRTAAAAQARPQPTGRVVRAAIWLPGLAVAVGAAVATAHGLYEVAAAARVPAPIAWLYPLITDGLALVAYTATARLIGSAARYAWAVVVLAAGLSGLAQATYLAGGSAVDASPVLRFGVGAWPAIAAAIVAHLLYLLATDHHAPANEGGQPTAPAERSPLPVQPQVFNRPPVQPEQRQVEPSGLHRRPAVEAGAERPALPAATTEQPGTAVTESPARDRARAAAMRHAARHHSLPTVSVLAELAQVSRGTAAAVLKPLRDQPTPLHLINNQPADTPDERAQK